MIKKLIQKMFDIHPDAMSFKQGLDLTGLPIITLYQGNTPFNFILDTGSDVSVIDSNALSQIKHEVVKSIKGTIYGIDGKKHNAKVCSITLNYKDKFFKHQYLTKDLKTAFSNIKQDHGVILHGMLGSKFFNEYRYVLDFAELIAYSKK